MSDVSLQARRVMSQINGTAPENVFAVRHKKKGWMGGERPLTYTNLRQARVNATTWARNEADNENIFVVEFQLIEVNVHTRQKQKGGI